MADRLDVSFVGLLSDISGVATTLANWSPFNQYPPLWVRTLAWWIRDSAATVPLGAPPAVAAIVAPLTPFSIDLSLPVSVSSTPPCLFEAAVLTGGNTIRFWLIHCVHSFLSPLQAGFAYNPLAAAVAAPVIPAGQTAVVMETAGFALFDYLTIHVPYVWIAANPSFPQVVVSMQATFFKWMGVDCTGTVAAAACLQPLNNFIQWGPYAFNTNWVTTAPELMLSALTFHAVIPGNPAGGIAPNTIAGTELNALYVIFTPGVQLQGGNVVTLSMSFGALNIVSQPGILPRGSLAATNGALRGLLLANAAAVNLAAAFIAIGPSTTCARALGSVNCCSQSLGSILVPWPSYLTYPSWWNSLAIRLGPVGCVLPAGKITDFVVPKVYLGQNPVDGVTDAFIRRLPGFIQIDARLSTSAEPLLQLVQRRSELWPLVWTRTAFNFPVPLLGNLAQAPLGQDPLNLAFLGGLAAPIYPAAAGTTGVPPGPTLPGAWPTTWITTDEALGQSNPMSMLDAVRAGGLGSWVVGLSSFVSVAISIDNNVAGLQPSLLTIMITLRNGLTTIGQINGNTDIMDRGVTAAAQAPTVVNLPNTAYWFTVTSIAGVFRHNVGSVNNPNGISNVQPSACNTAFTGFTTALGTLFLGVSNPGCIAASTANTVITIPVKGDFLLTNPAAGSPVYFDLRLVPSMRQGFMSPGDTLNILPVGAIIGPVAVPPALPAGFVCPVNVGTAVVNTVVNGIDTGRCNNVLDNRFPGGIASDQQTTDTAATMWVLGYVTVADCRTLPYTPGSVGDFAAATSAGRCTLVNAMALLSPTAFGFKQCNDGATVSTAQNLVSYFKYPESQATSLMWPLGNIVSISSWPQSVGLPGTWPLFIYSWGYMFSQPMFGIVVTYPATAANLRALGAVPSVNNAWTLGFLVKMDRITSACSVNVVEENPWTFCTTTTQNVVQILHFPVAPFTGAGVPLNTYNQYTGWTKNSNGACATVLSDGAVAGWYTIGVSPNPGDDSDAAWYAFFAFFALPLLLLCCCLLAALWYFRKRPEPVYVPEYPVQEMYWVNAQPVAPVYSMEPALPAMSMAVPPTTPIYLQ